uniref:Ig-like domain-containing protein n=1 Tax=Oryzias latipes TaxID=8090 RepID=A0A3P9M9N0_ORYLA
ISTLTHLSLMFADAEVSCQLGQSCILPCRFTPGDDLVIHWFKMTPTLTEVHSFCYNDKDQWGHLDQKFGGRTSLFQDQISKGNASLQLTGVMVQDEGRYQCHTICGQQQYSATRRTLDTTALTDNYERS